MDTDEHQDESESTTTTTTANCEYVRWDCACYETSMEKRRIDVVLDNAAGVLFNELLPDLGWCIVLGGRRSY